MGESQREGSWTWFIFNPKSKIIKVQLPTSWVVVLCFPPCASCRGVLWGRSPTCWVVAECDMWGRSSKSEAPSLKGEAPSSKSEDGSHFRIPPSVIGPLPWVLRSHCSVQSAIRIPKSAIEYLCLLSSACRGVLWGRSSKSEAPSSESEDGSSFICPLSSVFCHLSSACRGVARRAKTGHLSSVICPLSSFLCPLSSVICVPRR